jgi:hypothetical protein
VLSSITFSYPLRRTWRLPRRDINLILIGGCPNGINIDHRPGAVARGLGTNVATQQKLGIPAEWRTGCDSRHCFDSRSVENRLTGYRWL